MGQHSACIHAACLGARQGVAVQEVNLRGEVSSRGHAVAEMLYAELVIECGPVGQDGRSAWFEQAREHREGRNSGDQVRAANEHERKVGVDRAVTAHFYASCVHVATEQV